MRALLVCLLPCALWAQTRPAPPLPKYEVKRATSPIVIDGKLDDKAWAAANTTVAQQAQWLAQAAQLAKSSSLVRLMIVFNVDFTVYGDDPQAGYAIVRPGGSCPACDALRGVTGGR